MHIKHTLIVVGGGAAGFFCAVNAAAHCPDLQVILLEKTSKLLSKVKISGGGRCNVTNASDHIGDMAKQYPRGGAFLKKAFHRFFTNDARAWFESRGVPLKAEPDGRVFPVSNSSQSVIDCLLGEASRHSVNIWMNAEVKAVDKTGDSFVLSLADGRSIKSDYLVIACGGYPKNSMFSWLGGLGHTWSSPVPSLFTFNTPGHSLTSLMGLSVPSAQVKISGTKLKEQGPLMITHWGLSGPCILRLSAWAALELAQRDWRFSITVNWLPDWQEESLRKEWDVYRKAMGAQNIYHKNPWGLPSRLWAYLLESSEAGPSLRWAELPSKVQNKLIKNLCAFPLDITGKTIFKEEFVTAGGIHLNEVEVNTMMSKKTDRLYFAGEILDIDGITGGYNFQNAWTTAYIAAQDIAAREGARK